MSKSVRRPSPALIVAVVALVAALAGSAIALPGKNSVKKNDLAKNSVVSKAIKNNKVKGVDIDEASLGTVPSAANAGEFSRYFNSGLKKANIGGADVPLVQVRQFTVIGRCEDDGGDPYARTFLTTSAPNASAYAYDDSAYQELDPGEELEVGYGTSGSSPDGPYYSYYDQFTATSSDGATSIQAEAQQMVSQFGSDCAWRVFGFDHSG